MTVVFILTPRSVLPVRLHPTQQEMILRTGRALRRRVRAQRGTAGSRIDQERGGIRSARGRGLPQRGLTLRLPPGEPFELLPRLVHLLPLHLQLHL